MTDYSALLDKLRAAKGPFEWGDAVRTAHTIYPMKDQESGLLSRFDLLITALSNSLAAPGAALALVERELPGWRVGHIIQHTNAWECLALDFRACLTEPGSAVGYAPTLALAVLIAWAEAMKEQN